MLIMLLDLLDTEEEKNKFEQLYNKYDKLMMYVSDKNLHDHDLAEEAVQDAWLYIAKNFNKIGDVDDNVTKNYLALIAKSFSISKFRKETKLKKVTISSNEFETECDNLFEITDVAELKWALEKLDEDDKSMLYLTYVYGYTSNEVSEVFGISADNVRKRIQFAKIRIRKILGDDFYG